MSDDSILIEVEGVKYDGWTEATITKSLTDFCGTFSFTGTAIGNKEFPIKRGQACKIYINFTLVITGYVERIDVENSSSEHTITVSGRDRTLDIVDSTLGSDFKTPTPISLVSLTDKVLDKLNLLGTITATSLYQLDDFKTADKPEVGVSAFEFIQKNARKRQVLMTTDFDGNIVFDRASGLTYDTILSTLPGDPTTIISSAVSYDDTKRFNRYIMSNQKDSIVDLFTKTKVDVKKAVNVKTGSTDNEIRNSRIYYFSSDDTSNQEDAQQRTDWELDYRRSHAFIYRCTVKGFTPKDDPEIWRPNRLIRVNDAACDQTNTTLLITSIEFSQSSNAGSTTRLSLVSRDSFMTQTRRRKHTRQVKESNQGNNLFG